MEQLRQETVGQLADRWTVLMNELNRYGARHYPDLLCIEVLRLVAETERLTLTNPFEADLIFTARTLIANGEPKVAMFKLLEVISGQMPRR
jgi:hypothetical protein